MAATPVNETMTLKVNGVAYSGWQDIRVSRGIDRMACDFDITVTERWADDAQPWQIKKFDACTVCIGSDVILTGYVDKYDPSFDARTHTVRVSGRSKTEDVIDCTAGMVAGQYSGYTLDAIARAICAPFGIAVVVQADVGEAFPDATREHHETGFEFLERLARLRGVLLCDNEQGNLVLAQAGSSYATDALTHPGNIIAASAVLNGAKQFSAYYVQTQSGEGMAADTWNGAAGIGGSAPVVQSQVVTTTSGVAYDTSVPRYRPHTIVAESALDAKGAQARADWQMRFNAAHATQANVTVKGWRQSDGSLWKINTLTPTQSAWLQLDRPLLIARVSYVLNDKRGRCTDLVLGPVEGFTPDPGQVKVRKNKVKGGGSIDWNGAGGS